MLAAIPESSFLCVSWTFPSCVTCTCHVCAAAYVSLRECSLCPVHACPASLEQILMLTLTGDAEAT